MIKKIEIHYNVYLDEKDFNTLLKHAEELGHDFGDAGKMETMRRYFQSEGVSESDGILQDMNAVKVETIL